MKIFVYGTLKEGFGNHRLLAHLTKDKDAKIEGYAMKYSSGTSGFPVIYPDEDSVITGEIFDIGDCKQTLRRLDGLEGEGSMYIRTELTTQCGEQVSAYVGPESFWNFSTMQETTNVDGEYSWP